jgi:CHAD domain-containing protein
MSETTPPLRLLPPHVERVATIDPQPVATTDLGSEDVLGTISVAALAFVSLRRHTRMLLASEEGARLGADPERLHDMRVASRRLRAAFSLFREYLPARGETLRRELTRLGRALGTVRDLDVRLGQLAAWREGALSDDATAFDAIRAVLEKERDAARVKLVRLLDTPRHKTMAGRLADFVRRGPGTRPALGKRPAVDTAPELLGLRYRKARKAGKRLSRSSPAADFHRMRILAKRLRYALEFHEPLYDGEVRSMIGHLTSLQDLLGQHQDLHVGALHLEALAVSRRKLPPRARFVMGAIASRLEQRAEELRRQFKKAFREVRKKRWNGMMKTIRVGNSAESRGT